ncbi:MAG TPA: hypothetical protein VFV19_13325 [Candidatus Polarisedimenticolaceae bacterium]|nr:hypothetical protein [Candidatus Polarisedimenticolaceae bacterium]
MAETPLGSHETPEEVLESEIRELEKRTLNSGWLWGAAALSLVLLAAAAFLITFWDSRQAIAHRGPGAPEAMTLSGPRGAVDRNVVFRWARVEGADSYIVWVKGDGDEDEFIRPVHDTFLQPSDTEVSNLNPGTYTWSVEARSPQGQPIGYGEAKFTIPPGQ